MMSKNSIAPFLKDYLIKFLTRPFLLDTNEFKNLIYWLNFVFHVPQNRQAVSEPVGSEEGHCAAPKRRRRPPEETNVRSGERLKRSPAKAG